MSLGNYEGIKEQILSNSKNSKIDSIKIERAEDFCHSVADGTHESPKPSDTGYPLITSKSLKGDGIDFSDSYLINDEDYNSIRKRSWVEPGDILFAMIGTIGNPVAIKENEENIATKNVGIFRFNGNHYKSTWFLLFLNSSLAKIQIERELSGSTQKYFALNKLRNLKIPIPLNRATIERAQFLHDQLTQVSKQLNKNYLELEKFSRLIKNEWFQAGAIK